MRPIVVLIATLVSGAAWAEGSGPTLLLGHYQHVTSVGVGWALPDFWQAPHGSWELAAHPELQLNQHRIARADFGPDSVAQVGAAAIWRARRAMGNWRPYAEFGLGGNLFSRVHFGEKDLSTAFQFSEHIGLGIEWHRSGGQHEGGWVGWRLSHYSNAGLGEHNDGLNTNALVVGLYF